MPAVRKTVTALAALLLVACGGGDSGKKAPDSKSPAASSGEGVSFHELDFPAMNGGDFAKNIEIIRASQDWNARTRALKSEDTELDPRKALKLEMDREMLEESFDLGCAFLANWQLPEGNFRYMYDWIEGTWVEDDHQVRQAGSLWGLGTCYRYKQQDNTKTALDKGLRYWFARTIEGPGENTLTMKYNNEKTIHSGSVALVALAIIEYLKTDAPMDPAWKTELETKLDGYLNFLVWMQRSNGHFSERFDHKSGKKRQRSSPYYDGETLLALCKAARQLGKTDLVPTIERAARATAETYTVKAWSKPHKKGNGRLDRDSNKTKGFFQWGSMAFSEYYQAGWKDKDLYGDVAVALGYWMIHTHHTLKRRRNHAYAVEGLIAGWTVAHLRGEREAELDLLFVLDRSLHKLGQWQHGGPVAHKNKWLKKNAKEDPMSLGGVMNAAKPSGVDVKKDVSHQLRIDVTQHQMHATSMALEDVYLPLPK